MHLLGFLVGLGEDNVPIWKGFFCEDIFEICCEFIELLWCHILCVGRTILLFFIQNPSLLDCGSKASKQAAYKHKKPKKGTNNNNCYFLCVIKIDFSTTDRCTTLSQYSHLFFRLIECFILLDAIIDTETYC